MSPLVFAQSSVLEHVDSFAVYYGYNELTALKTYDLVILQAAAYSAEELQELQEANVLKLAYLSIGEIEAQQLSNPAASWILAKNPLWDSFYIDVRASNWQALKLQEAKSYLAKGFDGIMLDTIDTVDAYPETKAAMTTFINRFRLYFSDAILIQNRGFSVLNQTHSSVDALLFENMTSLFNFETQSYQLIDNTPLIEQIKELQEHSNLIVLSLDYADPNQPQMMKTILDKAKQHNFIAALSEINLQKISPNKLEP